MTRREKREAKHAIKSFQDEIRITKRTAKSQKRIYHWVAKALHPHSRYPWRLSAESRERAREEGGR